MTKSYVLRVPRQASDTSTSTDVDALQDQLRALLVHIDEAGESVIAIQAVEAGWGSTFNNNQISGGVVVGSTYGAGLGFSYTDALIILTRTL